MTIYFTPIMFLFISFVFSILGMGGGQLYIPILFWLGMNFKTQAIPLGMLLNIATTLSASIIYAKNKLINWKMALPFGLAMVIFAPIGTWANIGIPTKPIIFIFALFTLGAGILMLSEWKPQKNVNMSLKFKIILGIISGSILGFFTGLLGRGAGNFVVPILFIIGLFPKIAVATSSFVVTLSGTSGFISHLFTTAKPNWPVWIFCLISVIIGSQLGSRFMAKKLDSKSIGKIFGIISVIVAIILICKNVF
jgi:uncharacterized membrane protein YfcA